jgi:hypothetical protein
VKLQIKNKNVGLVLSVIAIFVVSLILRFYRLDKNIPSVYADETGQYWLYQALIGGHSNILSIPYLSTYSFVWLFGLSPLGVRFGSALFGSFIGVVLFYLGYVVSKRKTSVALICGILGVILPWSYMISRIGHTHIPIIVLLSSLHLALLINAKSFRGFLISLVPIILSVFYYPTILIVSPLAIAIVFFKYFFPQFNQKQKRLLLAGGVFFTLILGYVFVTRYNVFSIQGRGGDLAIWRDVNVTADFNSYRGLARLADPHTEKIANKIFYNYPLSIVHVFVKNYLSFFSPDFLFLKGDSVLRHSTGMVGGFFPFLLPFMLYGAFAFFKEADARRRSIFLVWILMSPVPAAITKDGATYLLRVITLMPILTYFCALGAVSFFDLFKNKWQKLIYSVVFAVAILFSAAYFFFGYFYVYPSVSASSWEYGFKEISDFQISNPGKIFIIWDDKYPVDYFCFWQKLPAGTCDQTKMNTSEMINSSRVDLPLINLLFSLPQSEADFDQIIVKYNPRYVAIPLKYTTLFPEFTKKIIPIETIKYPDQTIAFSIYQVNQLIHIVE